MSNYESDIAVNATRFMFELNGVLGDRMVSPEKLPKGARIVGKSWVDAHARVVYAALLPEHAICLREHAELAGFVLQEIQQFDTRTFEEAAMDLGVSTDALVLRLISEATNLSKA